MNPFSQPIDFVREIESNYDRTRPDSLAGCAGAVEALMSTGLLAQWFNDQLRVLKNDPTMDGDWSPKEVVLHRGQGWTVSVALLDTPRRYVHVLPSFSLWSPIGPEGLHGERYRLPENYRNEVFDPSVRIELLDQINVRPRSVLYLDTDRFAYFFSVTRSIALLRVETDPVRPMEWLFSRQTLQAWQANDATITYTQLRVAAYVLGKIAHQSSIAPLKSLSRHPHHAVRWAAIQNLGRLNRSEALARIKEALSDAHPHVRRAAQKTLEKLEGKTPAR